MNKEELHFCERCKIVYSEGYMLHRRICNGHQIILDLPDILKNYPQQSQNAMDVCVQNNNSKDTLVQNNNSKDIGVQNNNSKETCLQNNNSKDTCIQNNNSKDTCVQSNNSKDTCVQNSEKTKDMCIIKGKKANSKATCMENGEKLKSELKCDTCGFTFDSKAGLIGHVKVCGVAGPSGVNTRKKLACMHADCDASFFCETAIFSHLEETHGTRVAPTQLLKFEDVREFRRWKRRIEKETRNDYDVRESVKGNATYYYCQKDSPEWSGKICTKISKDDNKSNDRAHKSCISFMKVIKKKSSVVVYYHPTHSHRVRRRRRAPKHTERDVKALIKANNLTEETMDKKLMQIDHATVKKITDSEYAEYDMYRYNRYEQEILDAALYGEDASQSSADDSGCSLNAETVGPEATEMQVKRVRQSLSRLTDMFKTAAFPSQLVQHADYVLKDLLRGFDMMPPDVDM